MAIDWDADLLGPVMAVFGEGREGDPSTWPTYHPQDGSAFQLRSAVFDREYRRVVDLGEGVTGSSIHPVLGVRDALFADTPAGRALQNDKVFIPSEGKLYAVIEPQPDGHGHTLLILIETKG